MRLHLDKPPAVMGIDPGGVNIGVGVLTFATEEVLVATQLSLRDVAPSWRVAWLVKRIAELFETRRIVSVVIEDFPKTHAPGKTSASASAVRETIGALEAVCCLANVQVSRIHPTKLKKAVTGNGHASKRQMQKTVQARLKMKRALCEHEADALACAIYCRRQTVQ